MLPGACIHASTHGSFILIIDFHVIHDVCATVLHHQGHIIVHLRFAAIC